VLQQVGTLRDGRRALDDDEVIAPAPAARRPCLRHPRAWRMRMQMLDLMVGLDEHVSLMLMPQFGATW
jgi:hypothetical protein